MKTHFAYKPKIQPLPKNLFLEFKERGFYKMITTESPRVVGIMDAEPTKIDGKKFFQIFLLYIKEQRQGYGKEFIEFAKNRSKQLDCEGRLFLMADSGVLDAEKPPHIFYRKQGFTTSDKKYLKKIDSFIKENKEMENEDSKPIYMYYLPDKLTFLQQIVMRVKEFFKM